MTDTPDTPDDALISPDLEEATPSVPSDSTDPDPDSSDDATPGASSDPA